MSVGCGGPSGRPPASAVELSHVQIVHRELTDEQFDAELSELLVHGAPTAKRLNTLVAVVRRQLQRAGEFFDQGYERAGLRAVEGALLLVRVGELRQEMFTGAEKTLLQAAAVVSRRGDEGRATALYSLADAQLSPTDPKAKQVASHLDAIHQWQKATQNPATAIGSGDLSLAAMKRVLMQPTPKYLEAARKATELWVQNAIKEQSKDERPRNYAEQDERIAAGRALFSGAMSLAAIYLRSGDAAGAVVALDSDPIAAVSAADLVTRLNQAADGNPDAWAELFGFYASSASENRALDPDIARGAAFGAAVQLYRTEPKELRSTIPIATFLVEQEMATVAPLVLRASIEANPEPRALSWALRLVHRALAAAESTAHIETARRIYHNAAPLLKLASTPEMLGRVRPSSVELTSYVGGMESRAGYLREAQQHLQEAAAINPTRDVLRLLAAIQRQRGDFAGALNSVRSMAALAQNEGDIGVVARAYLAEYEILRDMHETKAATAALGQALKSALKARASAHLSGDLAFAEATLAEVLEHYGKLDAANRASDRAEDAARNDMAQLAMTLQDAARRALTTRDLSSGRETLRRAIDARLDDGTLVYVALWTQLLEKLMKKPGDGSVADALSMVEESDSWVGSLREWGRHRLTAAELLARAETPVQKVEAEFYVTARKFVTAPTPQTVAELKKISKSEAIELVEVRIARDLVSPERDQPPPPLPPGVTLP